MIRGVRKVNKSRKKKKAERALEKAKKQKRPAKRVACPEDIQIYNWQRTHKKAWWGHQTKITGAYTPRSIADVKAQLKKKKKKYLKPPGPK